MKKIKKLIMWSTILLAILGTILSGNIVKASQLGFSVTANVRELDNRASDQSFFDLILEPGQKQTVTVTLKNDTNRQMTVEQEVSSATTNINGVVEYSPNNIEADKSLRFNYDYLVQTEQEIVLAPHSEKTINIDLQMPEEHFDGQLVGGLTYREKIDEEEAIPENQEGLAVTNRFAFVIALLMRQNKVAVEPDLKLHDVGPGQVNYRNVINANLQNPAMTFLNRMHVNAKVQGIDNPEIEYSVNRDRMQMAPNTNFDFPISLEGQPLRPGRYRMTMTVNGVQDDQGDYTAENSEGEEITYRHEWQFEREFTITAEKADELNERDVTLEPEDRSWLKWLLVGLLLLLILLFLWFILWKRRKKEDEEEKAKKEAEIAALKAQLGSQGNTNSSDIAEVSQESEDSE
ncbi:DUF916 and DUF3324 domain-containing protein [Lactococcus formosensis]|uniref:DUF916 and DUF3324 domain-containing protein n=2 Tax=Lactococcus TaxID=1357 RepID=UPI0022DF1D86|nr:DUF916 and DUF3324 domain-containing protein [Lactococcus formosensis]